jgi:hypothetical protein
MVTDNEIVRCIRCDEIISIFDDNCPECGSPISDYAWELASQRLYEEYEIEEIDIIEDIEDKHLPAAGAIWNKDVKAYVVEGSIYDDR